MRAAHVRLEQQGSPRGWPGSLPSQGSPWEPCKRGACLGGSLGSPSRRRELWALEPPPQPCFTMVQSAGPLQWGWGVPSARGARLGAEETGVPPAASPFGGRRGLSACPFPLQHQQSRPELKPNPALAF